MTLEQLYYTQGLICVSSRKILISINRRILFKHKKSWILLFYSVLDHLPPPKPFVIDGCCLTSDTYTVDPYLYTMFRAQYFKMWLPKKAVYKWPVCIKMRDFRFVITSSALTAVQGKQLASKVIKCVTIIWKTPQYALCICYGSSVHYYLRRTNSFRIM